MRKQILAMSVMVFAVLALTGCMLYEPETAAAAQPAQSWEDGNYVMIEWPDWGEYERYGGSPVRSLQFNSLEEFLYSYAAAREGRAFWEDEQHYLEHRAEWANFAALETIHLLTSLPPEFQFYYMTVHEDGINIGYADITEPPREYGSFSRVFYLHITRTTYEDLAEWGHETPLCGRLQQTHQTVDDLIDGRYLFYERTGRLSWAEGSSMVTLTLPRGGWVQLQAQRRGEGGFNLPDDMLPFAQTTALNLQDEANLAAWSAGDFSAVEEFVAHRQVEPERAAEPADAVTDSTADGVPQDRGIQIILFPGSARRTLDIPYGEQPIIIDGRVFAPLRIVAEALGFNVDWDAQTQTVYLTVPNYAVHLQIGGTMYVNGHPALHDFYAQIVNGRTMIPLRSLGEATGRAVFWDEDTRTVYIH